MGSSSLKAYIVWDTLKFIEPQNHIYIYTKSFSWSADPGQTDSCSGSEDEEGLPGT